jgi:hypothetical protein
LLKWFIMHKIGLFLHLSVIALGYGLNDRGFESREELGIFLFTTVSRQALGPASYRMGMRGSFSGGKAAGA